MKKLKDKIKVKAILFDLGDTLIEYEGIPLNWSMYYNQALKNGFNKAEEFISDNMLNEYEKILTKYNTRINPREIEVSAIDIFTEICQHAKISKSKMDIIIDEFYGFFQQKSRLFEDTIEVLKRLKIYGIKIGILTDVAYGMPSSFIYKDIEEFDQYIDALLTSADVGYRKPRNDGYLKLCEILEVLPETVAFVGNEKKDIDGANKSGMTSILINRMDEEKIYGEKYQIDNMKKILEIITV